MSYSFPLLYDYLLSLEFCRDGEDRQGWKLFQGIESGFLRVEFDQASGVVLISHTIFKPNKNGFERPVYHVSDENQAIACCRSIMAMPCQWTKVSP